jgi:crotonobetainyl-CoA:carnitine CoA-transferase CaiB-like acyl-CoA transferase
MTGTMGLPLAGIRVLDFTHAAAGPFGTMLLGDLGAEIIKIERTGSGDGSRTMGSPMPGFPRRNSDYYLSLNRNKSGIALDLAKPQGADLARQLAARSDIVAQNFRPGVMERLGLGYEDLRRLRPGLIYCSISAFGPSGPWAARPANDIIMQSVSGLMGVTGEVGGGPVRIGAPISDFSTGLFAMAGVLAALFARDRFPEGQHVQVGMLEASLNMMCNYIPSVADNAATIPRLGRGHAQIVPYQAFLCADSEYVMVGAFTRNFWRNLCAALNRTEWTSDPRFATNSARLVNRDMLVGLCQELFREKTRAEWLDILERADVPCSPVLELHDAIRTEQVAHCASLEQMEGDGRRVSVLRSPVRVDAWSDPPRRMAPDLGRDTRQVLADILGLDNAAIDRLQDHGAVHARETADAG